MNELNPVKFKHQAESLSSNSLESFLQILCNNGTKLKSFLKSLYDISERSRINSKTGVDDLEKSVKFEH